MENNPQQSHIPPSQPYIPPGVPPKNTKGNGLQDVLSTIAIIIAAPILALLLTAFVFQAYEVDGESMESTLDNHDRLIVLKVPRTWSRITRHAYVPKRYDIVVFNHRDDYGFGQPSDKQLIKRVIGLPGDRVVVEEGRVTIYNSAHPNGYAVDTAGPENKTMNPSPSGNNVDQTILPGQVFLMGDNRGNSLDSRAFGAVEVKDIVGKLSARVYPFDSAKHF
jgi:signal peptidase I